MLSTPDGTQPATRLRIGVRDAVTLLLAGVCFVAGGVSLWLEIGPYAWISASLKGSSTSYSTTIPWVLTIVIFGLAGVCLFMSAGPLQSPGQSDFALLTAQWRARTKRRLFGPLAVVTLGIVVVSAFALLRDTPVAKVGSFCEAASLAAFLPTEVSVEGGLSRAHLGRSLSIEKDKNGRRSGEDIYTVIDVSVWPEPGMPVLLHKRVVREGDRELTLRGVLCVRKCPVPWLLRSAGIVPESAWFAVIMTEGRKGAVLFWIEVLILSAILAVVFIRSWWNQRKLEARLAGQGAETPPEQGG